MVFQSYALYPHMTVYDNMAFSMKIGKESKAEIDRRVKQAAEILQLTKYLDRLPKAMSGGQRQRVAIGRAIVRNPKVFLFDEPLSNLDAALRVATRIEIAKLKESMPNTTMIYVTHDQVEAMSLADRIVVMNDGVLQQVGTPTEVYLYPANLFVAQFIGSPVMNIAQSKISATDDEARVSLDGASFGLPRVLLGMLEQKKAGQDLSLGIRPEGVLVSRDQRPGYSAAEAHIIQPFGGFDIVDLKFGTRTLRARTTSGFVDKVGTQVFARLDPSQAHFFDSKSGASLGIRLGN
jgi:multiple sugar transport system ATP-binding protein